MLYTSGTTGVPKGVKVTRKSALNVPTYYNEAYGLTNDDVYGMFATVGFDAGSWAILSTICAGACLAIIPEDIRLDMNAMNDYFIKQGVTHTFITTQVGKLFVDSVEDTSLDVLVVGGEKLGEFASPENYELIDIYGPTEAFVFVASKNNNDKIDSSSVGDLIYNTKAYILDEEFRRVPVGAVGELYLAGDQIAEGYLNNEEETSHAFIDNPFDEGDYGVLYRTGDMVRVLPDKSLGVVGRRDSQVKIRGNRVELSEIESVIREMDYVDDVTVQTIKHDANSELVAYVVVSNELEGDMLKDAICDYVGERKPEYMIPSFVIGLDEIPVNVNGKVDRRALPEVDLEGLRVEYVAPTTEAEKDIVEAFEQVFNQDRIGVLDDFIRLGGDSLTAIKVLSYLKDYNVAAADILSLHTPQAIAQNIKKDSLDLDIFTLETGCPLNEAQLNVYLDIVANEKVDAYLIPLVMDISKEYDVDDIKSALDVMFEVHPILEMTVSDDYEVPYLVKAPKPSISVESDVDDDFLNEFLSRPFDLYGSLSRFLIVENENDYSLFGVVHHIIFDGLSVGVFKNDVLKILDGESIDVDDSFLKVSAFNHEIQNTDEYGDAHNFYDVMLADLDEASDILDDVLADGPGIEELDLKLDNDLFKSFLDKHGISENIAFTAAFAYTLSRFAGSDKVFFNINENGRDRFNNYGSIGMFVGTLPILADCKNQDVSAFIGYMSDLVYGVMKYDFYPFRLLASEYDIDASILFQYLPEWIGLEEEGEDLSADNIESGYDSLVEGMDDLITDLSVDIAQHGSNYSIIITYSDKYSKDMMERFMESYNLILSQMITADKLSEIIYVTESDLDLLDSYNATECPLEHGDILDAFNGNLSDEPNHNLVSYWDNVYTYSEGAFLADKIAKRLVDLGVEAQDCVGFLVDRSELYMFSVLGVMSIGAVYVPLDDAHPDDRIQFILEDTAARVLIVSDGTVERAKELVDADVVLLNISDIMKEDIGTLDTLPVSYGDLACILYTSGTTGIPKGVKITRKSVLNLSEFYIRKYGLGKDDVYALFASIGFDVAMKAIFPTICSGACLTVIPGDIKLDMKAMNDYFIKQGVTHTEISTQVAKLFISQVDETSLKVLTTGGEKLGESEIDVDYRFVDSYGPTEACVDVTSIDSDDRIDPSSIGFLLDNIKAYVLDDEFRRVPIGAVGELYLAGNQIANGYLNRDEETTKAFLDNPFTDEENYRVMYRTGDVVRVLPDGSLGIVGRRDSQVKIRGNRVELSEIEAVIREIDYIDDLTVQTIKNGTNNELVAYVVVSNELDGNELKDSISDYVAERKPPYMIPSFVVRLDKIPLNVNGKVDKRALPDVDRDSLQAEYVAPETEAEKLIVEAFEAVFDQENISVYDDFVRLGGDSLTAIRLLSYLDSPNITAADILSLHTPKAIAENMGGSSFDLDLYDLDSGCPLNEAQLNVYLDIIANNKVDSYLIPLVMDISKDYDIGSIESALDVMFDVHPILAMAVSDDNEVPYLVKAQKPSISVESDVEAV